MLLADLANNPLFFKSHHKAADHGSEIELVLDLSRQICAVRVDGESCGVICIDVGHSPDFAGLVWYVTLYGDGQGTGVRILE